MNTSQETASPVHHWNIQQPPYAQLSFFLALRPSFLRNPRGKLTITNGQTERLDQSQEAEDEKTVFVAPLKSQHHLFSTCTSCHLLQRTRASAFSLLVFGRLFLFTMCVPNAPEARCAGLAFKQRISVRRSFFARRSGRHGDGSGSLRGAVRGSRVTRTHARTQEKVAHASITVQRELGDI